MLYLRLNLAGVGACAEPWLQPEAFSNPLALAARPSERAGRFRCPIAGSLTPALRGAASGLLATKVLVWASQAASTETAKAERSLRAGRCAAPAKDDASTDACCLRRQILKVARWAMSKADVSLRWPSWKRGCGFTRAGCRLRWTVAKKGGLVLSIDHWLML